MGTGIRYTNEFKQEAVNQMVNLDISDASKKWTMSIRNWKFALNRFVLEFEDRLGDYI
jgi:putative transposase